jgi:tetratricopeptide (TPR) repeat protein
METRSFPNLIRELIARNDLPAALQQLRELLDNSPLLDEVILQSARFHDIRKQMRQGIVGSDEANEEQDKIRSGLLELLTEIERQEAHSPEIQQEIKHAVSIVNSKNVNAGNVTAGRDAHIGDKHYHYGALKIPRHLTPDPFFPEIFLGRELELTTIHDKLFAPGGNLLLLVNGEGGVGKTSIAAKYYRTYADEYAHLAWVLSEKNIAGALLQLAIPLGLSFDEQMDSSGRLQLLLQALTSLHKPCLLVIDNANEIPDLEANYQRLRQLPNFHLLLTTRITTFAQADTHRIEGLPEDKALELFQQYYPQFQPQSEAAIFKHIRSAVGGNTLVIELLAKNLARHNNALKTRYTLPDLLADLQKKGVLQLSQTQSVHTDYQSRGAMRREKPEDIIAAMYELDELPPEEVRLLSVFAVLPAESITFETLEKLLPDTENLDAQLLSLAQKGWIAMESGKSGIDAESAPDSVHFKCSPVVQEVVKVKNPDLPDNCGPLIKSLIRELDDEVTHLDNYQHSTLFARYTETLISVLNQNDVDQGTLCQNIGAFHIATGDLSKAMHAYQKMEDIFSALVSDNSEDKDFKNGLAISYSKLGETHSALGNLDMALTFYEQYNQLEKELYAAYPQTVSFKNSLAISYAKLGKTHSALGNLDMALTFYEERSRLGKELYEVYPQNVSFKNGLAISYANLGETHSALGNLEKALTFYEQYNQLEEELYASYPQNVSFKNGLAISYEKLGETHSALGNLDKALTFYEDETKLFEELYAAYPQNVSFKNGLAISYSKLGETHSALGNLEKALTFYEQYNQLEKELYAAYPQNVEFKNNLAISYAKLGEMHSALGNLEKALTFYEQYNQLEKEHYAAYPQNVEFKNNLAISYAKLGETHSALRNLEKALTFYEQYNQLEKELYAAYPQNVSFKNGLAISYSKLGETHSALGNLKKALTFYEERSRLGKELYAAYPQNVSFKNGLAISYAKLAQFNRDNLSDQTQARHYFQQAESLWLELVRDAPQYVQFQTFLGMVQRDLAGLA